MIRPIPLSLVLLPLALAACSKPAHGSGQGQPAAEHHGSPPIHVSQTVVALRHGQPAREHEYREHLAACSKLNVPVQPLDPAVVGKLGRTHSDTWYEGDRMAGR